MIKVNSFYKDRKSKEVYKITSIKNDKIKIEHTVENEAWILDAATFHQEYSLLRGTQSLRAEILADVIQQLNIGFLKATQGMYCSLQMSSKKYNSLLESGALYFEDIGPEENGSITNPWGYEQETPEPTPKQKLAAQIREIEINTVLKNDVKQCRTCAIGSVFISAVDIHNKLKFKDVSGDNDMVSYLGQWFSDDEMRSMEDVFESYSGYDNFYDELHTKYNPKYNRTNADIILREIISNTLKFGIFNPEKGLARKVLDKKKNVG